MPVAQKINLDYRWAAVTFVRFLFAQVQVVMKLAHPRHPLSDEMERKVGIVIGRSDAVSLWGCEAYFKIHGGHGAFLRQLLPPKSDPKSSERPHP